MVEINPLQLASQFQPKPADTSVMDKLRASSALAGINNRSLERRTGATNLSSLVGNLAKIGQSPTSIQQPGVLEGIAGDISFGRQAKGVSDVGGSGLGFDPKITGLGETTLGNISKVPIVPSDFKGVAERKAGVEATAKAGEKVSDTVYVDADGNPVGTIFERKTERSRESTGKVKNNVIAKILFDKLLNEGTIFKSRNPAYPGFWIRKADGTSDPVESGK
jgi:hypothetical protein